jgi:hypothetical protein
MPPSGSLCVWGGFAALRRIPHFVENPNTRVQIDRPIARLLDVTS